MWYCVFKVALGTSQILTLMTNKQKKKMTKWNYTWTFLLFQVDLGFGVQIPKEKNILATQKTFGAWHET